MCIKGLEVSCIKLFKSTSYTLVYLLLHKTVRISVQQSVLWGDETMCVEFMIVHFGQLEAFALMQGTM
jgi:hypothetical protein